jgi:hypothetical protein
MVPQMDRKEEIMMNRQMELQRNLLMEASVKE